MYKSKEYTLTNHGRVSPPRFFVLVLFTDPRSERFPTGARLAVRRAQQHEPRRGAEEANLPEQASLANEQHRLRGQFAGGADHTRNRR